MGTDARQPPEGAGPVLQRYRIPYPDALLRAGLTVALLVLAKLVTDGSGWIDRDLWWAGFGLLLAAGTGWLRRTHRLDAGSDWFRRGRGHVRLHRLTSVRLTGGPSPLVYLADLDRNQTFVELTLLRRNPDLYRIVHQGIQYSMRHAGARANDRARAYFTPDENPVRSDACDV
jgi:hypothetical protein